MATIRKRGDNQWQVEVRKKGFPAQRRTFLYKEDAERWGRQVESEMERRVFVDRSSADSTLLRDVLDRYLIEVTAHKKGKRQETALIKRLQKHSLAALPLSAIHGANIAAWRDARRVEVSAATVHREMCVISHAFSVAAKDWGIAIANPCAMVRKPKINNGRDRRLEGDEEGRLLEACRQSSLDFEAIVIIGIETAARLGELLKLDWRRINLDKRTAQLLDTKNGEDRVIPLSTRAVAALRDLPRHISGRVFYRWKAADSFNKLWVRACKRAGIDDLRFHDLRHEACSRLADKFHMHELMKITGHKTVAMLARYYHPKAEDLAKKLG